MLRLRAVTAMTVALSCAISCIEGVETTQDDDDSMGGFGGMGGVGGTAGMGGTPGPSCTLIDYRDARLYREASVSFSADVMPILQNNCTGNGSNCHSTSDPTPNGGLSLAPPAVMAATPDQVNATHDAIVGIPSQRSSLNLITAGDPAKSFLLAKVEYDNPQICMPEGEMCTPNCGNRMPIGNGSSPLNDDDKAILRTWIRDGALND